MGQKQRRRSSAAKVPQGDHLGLAFNPIVRGKILAKNNDNVVLFSDTVIKINKRNKMQERVLVITDLAIYNIEPGSYRLKRRIDLKELGEIRLSRLADNFFCLHVPKEYDYLLVSNKKCEIVDVLADNARQKFQQQLKVTFSNSFEYKMENGSYREIQFTAVDGGVNTQIFVKKHAPGLFG